MKGLEKKLSELIKQLEEKSSETYRYKDHRNVTKVFDEKFFQFIDKRAEFYNSKLDMLLEYPKFKEDIWKIKEGLILEIDPLQGAYDEEFKIINHYVFYKSGYKNMVAVGNEFFNELEWFFEKYKSNLINHDLEFIIIGYYILFNKIIKAKNIWNYINKNIPWQERDIEISIANFNNIMRNTEIVNDIMKIRKNLNIKDNDSVEEIINAYQQYNKYLRNYYTFNERNEFFYVSVYNIINGYEVLNIENRMDYLMLYYYILHNEKLNRKNLYDYYRLNHLPNFYTSEELLQNIDINENKIYMELPYYSNTAYYDYIKGLINHKVKEHYKIIRQTNYTQTYYMSKYINELAEKKKKELEKKHMTSTEEFVHENIIPRIDELYKDKYYSKSDIENNYLRKNQEEEEETGKEYIKTTFEEYLFDSKVNNIGKRISEYKRIKSKFESGWKFP